MSVQVKTTDQNQIEFLYINQTQDRIVYLPFNKNSTICFTKF